MTTATPPTRSMPPSPQGAVRPQVRTGAASIDPFRVVRKHLTAILASAVFGVILGIAVWLVLTMVYPLYQSSVKFEITPALAASDQTTTGDLERDEVVIRFARTEMAFLLSRPVLEHTLSDPDIRTTEWIKGFTDSGGNINIPDAVDELIDALVVRYVPDTNLFEVLWSATNRDDVPKLLNQLQRSYLRKRNEVSDLQFAGDLSLFTTEEDTINRELENLDAQIEDFVRQHDIFTLEQIRDHPIAHEVNSLNETIAQARSAVVLLQTQEQQIARKLGGEIEPTPEDISRANLDPMIQRTSFLIVDLSTQRRGLLERLSPDHKSVKDNEIALRAAEQEKAARMDEVMARNLNGDLKYFRNQLEGQIEMIQQREAELVTKDAALRAVAGKVSNYQSLNNRRDFLQEERARTRDLVGDLKRLRQRSAADRVRLLTRAETPREKSFPLPQVIIPLCFLLVTGLTVGIIFIRELTDKRVKSASDLTVVPGARVLGVIPDLPEDPTRIAKAELAVRDEPRSVIAESYRQSCTPILKSLERAGHQSLVIVGGLPSSGGTTVVTNLAAFLAAGGRRVVVIDANFRRPRLAEAMGLALNEASGLGDALVNKSELSQAIHSCGDGIDIIPAGTPANRVFERLNNCRFETLMAELRSRYDFIIIDAPPAIVAGDALVLANKADASVLVVRANQEQKGLVARLINQFSHAQSELLGVILNRPRWTAGGYFKKNYATMAGYASKASGG
ncbi:MAG: GumC family protein [Phycisphaerales bacterium]